MKKYLCIALLSAHSATGMNAEENSELLQNKKYYKSRTMFDDVEDFDDTKRCEAELRLFLLNEGISEKEQKIELHHIEKAWEHAVGFHEFELASPGAIIVIAYLTSRKLNLKIENALSNSNFDPWIQNLLERNSVRLSLSESFTEHLKTYKPQKET